MTEPDPLVLASINRSDYYIEGDAKVWECGCAVLRQDRWGLCRYHLGFEDGVEAAREEARRD